MTVSIRIPASLRSFTKDQKIVSAEGQTVAEVLENLRELYPGMGERLWDEAGLLRRFVNVFINDDDIRFSGGLDALVKDGDEITIISAIAGGVSSPGKCMEKGL